MEFEKCNCFFIDFLRFFKKGRKFGGFDGFGKNPPN